MADLYGSTFTGTYEGYTRKFRSYLHYTVGEPANGKVLITIVSAGLQKTSGNNVSVPTSGSPTIKVSLTGQTDISETSTDSFTLNGTPPVDHDFMTSRQFEVTLTTEPQILTLAVEYTKSSGAWKGSSKGRVQITVPAAYVPPTINNLVAYRSDTSGNPVANGTAITVKCQASGGSSWTYDKNNTLIKVNGTSKTVNKSDTSDPFSATTTATGIVAQGSSATIQLVFGYRDAQTSTVHTITIETYITAVESIMDAWYDSDGYHLDLNKNTTIGGKGIFEMPDLSATGLTPYSSRCAVTNGGYFVIGDMCFVQLFLTIKASLSSNNYWRLLDGLPEPATTEASLSAAVYRGSSSGGAYGIRVYKHTDDTIIATVVTDSYALANGNTMAVTGMYKIKQ